jgi:hypothetical protein
MDKNEALRLALEALELHGKQYPHMVKGYCLDAITAIKEALAESEPNYKKALEVWLDKTEWVQETVKPHELGMHRADVLKQRIEEASPQRTWVGLDEEDYIKAYELCDFDKDAAFEFFEAKLKEKNNG